MKRKRSISDLSAADLVALGMVPGHASMLRSRQRTPSLALAVKIERAYGIPPRAWLEPKQ